jgi:hypothetical protein
MYIWWVAGNFGRVLKIHRTAAAFDVAFDGSRLRGYRPAIDSSSARYRLANGRKGKGPKPQIQTQLNQVLPGWWILVQYFL